MCMKTKKVAAVTSYFCEQIIISTCSLASEQKTVQSESYLATLFNLAELWNKKKLFNFIIRKLQNIIAKIQIIYSTIIQTTFSDFACITKTLLAAYIQELVSHLLAVAEVP